MYTRVFEFAIYTRAFEVLFKPHAAAKNSIFSNLSLIVSSLMAPPSDLVHYHNPVEPGGSTIARVHDGDVHPRVVVEPCFNRLCRIAYPLCDAAFAQGFPPVAHRAERTLGLHPRRPHLSRLAACRRVPIMPCPAPMHKEFGVLLHFRPGGDSRALRPHVRLLDLERGPAAINLTV